MRNASLIVLLAALALAGCTGGPYADPDEQSEAGYDSITDRPPPGAPDAGRPVGEAAPEDANLTDAPVEGG